MPEAAVSASGLATLLGTLFVGPLLWAVFFAWRRRGRAGGAVPAAPAGEEGEEDGVEMDRVSRTGSKLSRTTSKRGLSGVIAVPAGAEEPDLPQPLPKGLRGDAAAQALWRQGSGRLSRTGSVFVPEDTERETMNSAQYLLVLLGYAIGIGNVWRFPYLVGKFGGGAFVVAYLVCGVFVATPLYLMEFVWGQYTRKSAMHCFNQIHPRWRGIGWTMGFMLFWILSYYNVLLAYCIVYIGASLQDPLPWSDVAKPQYTVAVNPNVTTNPPTAYWENDVLNKFESIDDQSSLGPVQGKLALGLFLVWVVVFFAIAFGKAVLEKVTYVTVIGPIMLMVLMLVRVLTLDGAADGVRFYIGKFDGAQLASLEMWATACGQILFSLSPGMGTAVTLSSFTKPKEDVFRVCLIVAVSNSLFSFVGGFAIFGVLGSLASRNGVEVAELASKAGPGLAFIAIADGIQAFGSGANAMSVLFFMMLLSLGLDSTFAWAETLVAFIEDALHARRIRPPGGTKGVTAAMCAVCFVSGLPYCCRIGSQLLDTVDHYGASYALLMCCFFESIMLKVDFSWERMAAAVKRATKGNEATPDGRDIPVVFKYSLYYFVPVLTSVLWVNLFIADAKTEYEGYPAGLQAWGWALFAACIIFPMIGCITKQGSTLPSFEVPAGPAPLSPQQKRVAGGAYNEPLISADDADVPRVETGAGADSDGDGDGGPAD